MELWNLLMSIPLPVLFIALAFLLIITIVIGTQYLKQKGLDGIRARVYQLFLQAEHNFTESAQGQQKLKWVVQQARGLLPGWLQLFITDDTLEHIINMWFAGVKDLLDDGKVNGSGGCDV